MVWEEKALRLCLSVDSLPIIECMDVRHSDLVLRHVASISSLSSYNYLLHPVSRLRETLQGVQDSN